jgi:hypothetical protein
MSSGFRITRGSGFKISLDNDWTVSVQFGAGTYSDNYELMGIGAEADNRNSDTSHVWESKTAEVAVMPTDDLDVDWFDLEGFGGKKGVKGRCGVEEVLDIIQMARTLPPPK